MVWRWEYEKWLLWLWLVNFSKCLLDFQLWLFEVLHAMNNMRAESDNQYAHNRIFWKTTGFYCFPYNFCQKHNMLLLNLDELPLKCDHELPHLKRKVKATKKQKLWRILHLEMSQSWNSWRSEKSYSKEAWKIKVWSPIQPSVYTQMMKRM